MFKIIVTLFIFSFMAAKPALAAEEPIEAWGTPKTLLGPPCVTFDYAPMVAYDRAWDKDRQAIGQLVLDRPDLLKAYKPEGGCEAGPVLQLKTKTGVAPVQLSEYAYEVPGIMLYELVSPNGPGGEVRGRGKAGDHDFWIDLPPDEVILYEDVAYLPSDLTTLCTEKGECREASLEFLKEVKEAGAREAGCYGEAYNVTDRIERAGRRLFRLERQELKAGSGPYPALPEVVYIPTRKPDGAHNSYFYSRGC